MRILSKFKDYYDITLAYGQDNTVVFERKKEDIKVGKFGPEYNLWSKITPELSSQGARIYPNISGRFYTYNADNKPSFNPFVVVFCGIVYHGVQVITEKEKKNPIYPHVPIPYEVIEYYYDFEQLMELFPRLLNRDTYSYSTLMFKDWMNTQRDLTDVMLEAKIPIYVHVTGNYGGYTQTNSKLLDIQFQQVKNSFQAYQDLSMFIAAMNTNEDIKPIPDEYLAKQKGFNCYSFKKDPTKHKAKRCKK